MTYSADATTGAPIWTVSDGTRSHTVTFAKLTVANQSDPDASYYYVVKKIDLAAFGGNTAHYVFHYNPDNAGTDRTTRISRRVCVCAPNGDPELASTVWVPLLTEVTLPDGTSYKMSKNGALGYNIGDATNTAGEEDTGNLTALTLPTLGRHEWDYQSYTFPHGTHELGPPYGGVLNPPENMNVGAGLKEQRLLDASNNKISVTRYETNILTSSDYEHAKVLENTVTVLSDPQDTNSVASKTLNYFTVDPQSAEYSLGITREPQPDPHATSDVTNPRTAGSVERYLSSKTYDASNHLVKATYSLYGDPFPFHLKSQEAVTYKPGTTPTYLNSARTDYSDFDGYGHYRSVTTSGDFAGATAPRTVTTAYNRSDTDVGGAIFDTGTFGTAGFHTWPVGTPWILDMYSSVTVTDGTSTQKSLACFDAGTAFLKRSRSMLGTSPATHDVVARFTPDAGNVAREEYFGGDEGAASGDIGAVPTTALCDATLNTTAYPRKYFLSHHYTNGSLDKTSYLDPTCQTTTCSSILDTADRTIDAGTGLPSASRDPSGLETTFDYDLSGRVNTMTPPGDLAATTYAYTAATGSANASVKVETKIGTTTNGLTSEYKYDSLGRLILESIVGAGATGTSTTRYRTTSYDAAGRKLAVSTLGTTTSPTHFTSYVYDALDRPVSVTEPDGSVTAFDYVSEASKTKRTVSVFTSSGDTAALTREAHDRQGHLVSLEEPNGTVTTYGYDIAGHLTSAAMPGPNNVVQHRYFNYDGRGFLQSEQHPEIGSGGDGTTTYSEYDARGHARHKLTGSAGGAYDLSFTYDAAERLTSVSDVNRSHPLKAFAFGDANGTGTPVDYRKGKLLTSVRSNTMPHVSGDLVVTETYKYENTTGRASERDTLVKKGTTTLQSFKQLFTYDTLGTIKEPGYPACLSPVTCALPTLSVTNTYTNGMLTSISGFASQLGYNTNGTLGTVTHANSVVDTITPDDNGLPRPKEIAYGGWSACDTPAAPSITASSPVACSSSNQASTPNTGLSYSWTISGGTGATITSAAAGTSITYNAGSGSTVTLSVTATNSCGSPATTSATVTVTKPSATVSGGGAGTQQIQAAISGGTSPYTITWSDNQTQTGTTPLARSASPSANPYTVTTITDANGCTGTSSGSAVVTPLAPTNVVAQTQDPNSLSVHVSWTGTSGTTLYRVDRALCMTAGCWGTIGTTANVAYDDTVPQPSPSQPVVTYLYRVIALAGTNASPSSALDFATTAANGTLFAEPIIAGSTIVKGSHVKELRNAIDAMRISAGLAAYSTWTGWPASYVSATGPILASHVGDMRRALDQALFQLKGASFPTTVNPTGNILAIHFNDLRQGVR